MGYDMRIVGKPTDEEIAAKEAAEAAFHAAVEHRSESERRPAEYTEAQAEVSRAYETLLLADVSYFRLNIGGMGRFTEIMDQFGMLKDTHPGDWPEKPEGLTWDQVNAVDPDNADDPDYAETFEAMTDEQRTAARAHNEIVEAHLRAHDRDTPGIAVHKLYSTNDGWLVTPGEIGYALKVYDETDAERRDKILTAGGMPEGERDYWDAWIGYLRRAMSRGGFRVF